jgi:hypothetical protein
MTDREIMQMALDALDLVTDLTNHDDEVYAAIEALRARLAQPEPEPVAWLYEGSDIEGRDVCLNEDIFEEQKPNCIPLYTAPPQREWQGLTDEEKKAIYEQADIENWHDQPLLEAVEAKLKEKNT